MCLEQDSSRTSQIFNIRGLDLYSLHLLIPSCFCGKNREMRVSCLNAVLSQQNPCLGISLHGITMRCTSKAAINCSVTTKFTYLV